MRVAGVRGWAAFSPLSAFLLSQNAHRVIPSHAARRTIPLTTYLHRNPPMLYTLSHTHCGALYALALCPMYKRSSYAINLSSACRGKMVGMWRAAFLRLLS